MIYEVIYCYTIWCTVIIDDIRRDVLLQYMMCCYNTWCVVTIDDIRIDMLL